MGALTDTECRYGVLAKNTQNTKKIQRELFVKELLEENITGTEEQTSENSLKEENTSRSDRSRIFLHTEESKSPRNSRSYTPSLMV